jgi:hypothetical protein
MTPLRTRYLLTKNCGHEISRVYAMCSGDDTAGASASACAGAGGVPYSAGGGSTHRGMFVVNALFSGFYNPAPTEERRFDGTGAPGDDTESMALSFRDAAVMLQRCIEVPVQQFPNRCQVRQTLTLTTPIQQHNTHLKPCP